jgi:hypothetical protein
MSNIDERLEESYEDLGRVLRSSQAFGLGPRVPPQLAKVLEKTLSVLSESMQKREEQRISMNGDLEAELSQDADREYPGVAK